MFSQSPNNIHYHYCERWTHCYELLQRKNNSIGVDVDVRTLGSFNQTLFKYLFYCNIWGLLQNKCVQLRIRAVLLWPSMWTY